MDIIVFSKEWFAKHQKILLTFSNTLIGRCILRIHGDRSSVGKNKIVKIMPNSITWISGHEYKTEFRTHDKFGKRLYYTFKPFWYLIHSWDQIANAMRQPEWNLGFDTLTEYPVAGSTTPCDGIISLVNQNTTLASLRNAANGNLAIADTEFDAHVRLASSTTTNQFKTITRGIFNFDTSDLTSGATISDADISFYWYGRSTGLGSDSVHVVSATPASKGAIANGDYDDFGTTSFANIPSISGATLGSYTDLDLDSNGEANINKTGVSTFGLRGGWELNNSFGGSWRSNVETRILGYFADYTGTTRGPKLVVTYTVSSGTDYEKDLSDTVSNSEALVKSLNRSLSESVGKSETFTKVATLLRSYNETVSKVETIYKQTSKTRSDSIGNSDNISKLPGKRFNDSLTVSEALTKIATLFRSYNDTVNFSEVIIKSPTKVLSDSQSNTDDASIIKTYLRSLSDQVGKSETIYKLIAVAKLETVGKTDTILKYLQRSISETQSIIDSITKVKTQFKSVSDSIGNSEIILLSKTQYRSLSDTVGKAEAFLKSLSRTRSDSTAVSDSVEAAVSGALNFMNVLLATDSIIKQTNKVHLETLSQNDTLIKQINRILLDDSEVVEDFSIAIYKLVEFIETVANVDNIARFTMKAISDIVLNVEQLFVSSIVFRTFDETVGNSELFSKVKNAVKNLSDSTGISDSISKFISKGYNETVIVVDKGLKKFLNGIELVWEKVSRIFGSWDKQARPTEGEWSKREKISGEWTKNTKPTPGDWTKNERPDDGDWTKQPRP